MITKIKKIVSVAVAATMVFALALPVCAEEANAPKLDTEDYVCDFEAANSDILSYRDSVNHCVIKEGKFEVTVWGPAMANIENHLFGDATYEFDMNVGTDKDWAGVMICKTNAADIWDHSGYLFLVTPAGGCQFLKQKDGLHKIAEANITGFENVENHYKIVKSGSSIKVYFGTSETPVIEVTDDAYASGYFSFVASGGPTNGKAYFDNLKIDIPGNDEEPTTAAPQAPTTEAPTQAPANDPTTAAPQNPTTAVPQASTTAGNAGGNAGGSSTGTPATGDSTSLAVVMAMLASVAAYVVFNRKKATN